MTEKQEQAMPNYDEMTEAPVSVSDDELLSIALLAERQMILEDWIENQEERLAEAGRNLFKITGEMLPEAMRSAGVKKFTLDNGCELNLDSKLRANITNANYEWAMNWIMESGNGAIIRDKFDLSFGADESEAAEEFSNKLTEMSLDFNQKKSIPWNTLDAFVRTEIIQNEPGQDWEDKFGVYRQTSVKIERPKT